MIKSGMKFLLVGLMLSVFAASAEAEEIALRFSVYTAGMHALDGQYQATISETGYHASATTKTMGMLDTLFEWRSTTTVAGLVEAGQLIPKTFDHQGQNRMGGRSIKVDFKADGPRVASIQGSGKYEDDSKGPAELYGLPIDVMTALTQGLLHKDVGGNLCAPNMDVFTGKRRNTIRFEYIGPEKLKPSPYTSFVGEAIKCQMHYDRQIAFVEDWEKSQRKKAKQDKSKEKEKVTVFVWLSPIDKMGANIPVRIESNSRYGLSIVHLQEFRHGDEIKIARKAVD